MTLSWYKSAQQVYRGDEKPVTIEDYDPDFNKEYRGGPGIYFTTEEEYAKDFGSNITKKTLQNANLISVKTPSLSYSRILKMLNGVDLERMQLAASNFADSYEEGKKRLAKAIWSNESAYEQILSIWADVFHHQNAREFMDLMVKNGIDGVEIFRPEDTDTHYVIYNKSVVK